MADDRDWLGLVEHEPGRFTLELTEDLIRLDGQLYGGTGLAAAVGAFSATTGRSPLWTTVQFVGTARLGDTLDIDVEQLAKGRSTTQTRLTAWHDGEVVLAALGSSGELRDDVIEADFGTMPDASDPETAPSWDHMVPIDLSGKFGPFKTAEFRRASEGTTAMMWLRMHDMRQTVETIAYLADFVPAGVVRAAGRVGVGISLDNSIRFGPAPDTEWILVDVDPYFARGGFLHGGARIWSQDGVLLAVAAQTSRARMFD
ncbi:hypothetical protein BH10ACT3_BH10ACT3_15400 [soil metagenome]